MSQLPPEESPQQQPSQPSTSQQPQQVGDAASLQALADAFGPLADKYFQFKREEHSRDVDLDKEAMRTDDRRHARGTYTALAALLVALGILAGLLFTGHQSEAQIFVSFIGGGGIGFGLGRQTQHERPVASEQ